MMGKVLGVCLALSCAAVSSLAQTSNKLIAVIPQSAGNRPMYTFSGPDTVLIDTAGNVNAAAASAIGNLNNYRPFTSLSALLRPLNLGIATQLSTLPIASPASGIILKEDPATGVALPSSQTLGPILTERAETIGARHFYIGFSRQTFVFDRLEGQKLNNFVTLYSGGDPTTIFQGGQRRLTAPVTFNTQVGLRLDQNIAFLTYGLTNRLDVSVGLPLVHTAVSATTFGAQIYNTGNPTTNPAGNCWCVQTFDPAKSAATFNTDFGASGFSLNAGDLGHAQQSATGIGDIIARVKGTVLDFRHAVVALGADVRFPSGDAKNYLGAGAAGFKPFVAVSLYTGELGKISFAPHVNFGYQINGKSVLGGDPLTDTKAGLPNALSWAVGSEIGFTRNFTLVADFLGQRLMDAFRSTSLTVPGIGLNPPQAQGYLVPSQGQSFSMNNAAVGFKTKVAGNLLFTANVLFALDDNGLRDKVVPLYGLSYTF